MPACLPGKTRRRLVFWLVLGELDRKPERKLGKLDEVREGEAGMVHTAVDPVPFLSGDGDVGVGGWTSAPASDSRSAGGVPGDAKTVKRQRQRVVSGRYRRDVSQGLG